MACRDRQPSPRAHEPLRAAVAPAATAPSDVTHAAGGVSAIESIDSEKSPSLLGR